MALLMLCPLEPMQHERLHQTRRLRLRLDISIQHLAKREAGDWILCSGRGIKLPLQKGRFA